VGGGGLTHSCSLGLILIHPDSFRLTRCDSNSQVLAWNQLIPCGLTRSHLVSSELQWSHLVSRGLTWSHLVSHSEEKRARLLGQRERPGGRISFPFSPDDQTMRIF